MRHLRMLIVPVAILALLVFGVRPAGAAPASTAPTWHVVPSPNVAGRTNNLLGIAAISAHNIWAVGYLGATTTTGYRTLIEHFNGSSWAVVRSPNPSSFGGDQLHAVVAIPGTSHLWAAGWRGYTSCSTGPFIQPLYEYYNGFSWNVVQSPVLPGEAHIEALAATSANDVWAVGRIGPPACSGNSQALIEHWNGQQWQRVTAPSVDTWLTSVTAVSSTDVWAVGGSQGGAVFEHWDGLSWTVVPTSGPAYNQITSISAVSATNIWGIGVIYVANYSLAEPLLAHYDGTTWTFTDGPSLAPEAVSLASIGVDKTSGQVWAAGTGAHGAGPSGLPYFPSTLHGTGSAWSFAPSPLVVGTLSNEFTAMAVLSAANVWAVGDSDIGLNTGQTLIEQYS